MSYGFRVDPKDALPIWRQIEIGIKRLVAAGALASGTAVPSVRELAQDLGVNPMTVAKAYQRLADAGVVESRRGEGTFVAQGTGVRTRGERGRDLRQESDRFAATVSTLGFTEADALESVSGAFTRLRKQGGGNA